MTKKICFIVESFISDSNAVITGPMVQTYLLGKELRQRGWDVHFVALSKENKDGLAEIYEGLTVHWVAYRKFFPVLNYKKVIHVLTAIDADFLYQRGRDVLTGFVANYCRKKKKKFIWASAGESGVEKGKYANQVSKKKRPIPVKIVLWSEAKINDLICEYAIRNAFKIVVQTEYQQKRLKKTFGLGSVLIRSGHPVPEIVERNLPLKVLWIGSIKPVKRPELFIELAELCRDLNCEFWMAGQLADESMKSFLLQKIQNMTNVKYLGAIPFQQSQDLISKAHALINTTDAGHEGLPNAFVQAWLAGTVTMSLNCDPDGVITGNRLGYLTDSLTGLRNALIRLINEPSHFEALRKRALEFGRVNFSIGKITDQLIDECLN